MSSIYQIAVSGSARGNSVEVGHKLAQAAGAALAKAGHSLLTGATTGIPELSAISYKAHGGNASMGISPATTKVEHVLKYRLPIKPFDTILYSGLHYVGRDALLINSADAVISIGGRLGTLHEFVIAMETKTPVAFLQGADGVSEEIPKLLEFLPNAHPNLLIFDSDPIALVDKLTKLLDELHRHYKNIYD